MITDCHTLILAASFFVPTDLDERWLVQQNKLAQQYLLENISPEGASPGSIAASTSRQEPNYFYHWVRDAAVVQAALNEGIKGHKALSESVSWQKLLEHIEFTKTIQGVSNPAGEAYGAGLGEVKFRMDGTAYTAPWGRPQHDGPALRAIQMIETYQLIAQNSSLDAGTKKDLLKTLYDRNIDARSIIKTDLEYVAQFWKTPSFDLWEEVLGQHFYTLMAARAAMVHGAEFAESVGDHQAARYYTLKSVEIDQALDEHWNLALHGRIAPTIHYVGGLQGKTADLDISVLLAVLHSGLPHKQFGIWDKRVMHSMTEFLYVMQELYPINLKNTDHDQQLVAPALGRYPEDVYDGVGFSEGHPWFLATLAYSEWMSRLVVDARQRDIYASGELVRLLKFFDIDVAEGQLIDEAVQSDLLTIAMRFFRRVRMHSDPRNPLSHDFEGRLDEQFNRHHGYMRGAKNLTWSYSAFLSAMRAYKQAVKK